MPRKSMNSLDIAVVVSELNRLVKEAFVDNIYHLKQSTLLIKLRREGSLNHLLIEAGRRIHLTWYLVQVPDRPSSFCMSLRKWLRNGRLAEVSQPESERIVVLDVSTWAGVCRLIVELFGKGNIVLVDAEGKIRNALHKRRMRDRDVVPGEEFRMPPPSGANLWRLTPDDLAELTKRRVSVVRALGSSLGVTSPYSDEALASAGMDPLTEASALTKEQLQALQASLQRLSEQATSAEPRPLLIVDGEGKAQDVIPFAMSTYSSLPAKSFPTFNQALDEYFTELSSAGAREDRRGELEQQLVEHERIVQQQLDRLRELQRVADEESRMADMIMANLPALKGLQERIISSRREGLSWDDISNQVSSLQLSTQEPLMVVRLDPATHSVTVKVEATELALDFLRPPQEEAQARYQEAKVARRKILGVEAALQHVKEKAMELRTRSADGLERQESAQRRREEPWYGRFHSFRSSEGFLVVAGKDAGSNEALIKRHVDPHDIVFHSEAPGAPFVVVKTEAKSPGEPTVHEAAIFTVCHSRAWRQGFGSSSAFYVRPEQVSKRAPSGEYLMRGSFMILGPRNYIRGVSLRYAVGVKVSDGQIKGIGGPEESVKDHADVYAVLIPGDDPATKLAKGLAARFTAELGDKGLIDRHTNIRAETIRELIPAGRGRLLERGGV